MTMNAVVHHNYIVRASEDAHIKNVNELINHIEKNNGEINKIETVYKNSDDKSVLIHFNVTDLTSIAMIKDSVESQYGNKYVQFMDEITHLHLGGKLESKLKNSINNMSRNNFV